MERARQQRLAHGLGDSDPVPGLSPERFKQPGKSPVSGGIYAVRQYATELRTVGRAMTFVGATIDAASFASQFSKDYGTGSYYGTAREASRIAGGWGGAMAMGSSWAAMGAEVGLIGGPGGALLVGTLGGLVGGALGYWAGSNFAEGVVTGLSGGPH